MLSEQPSQLDLENPRVVKSSIDTTATHGYGTPPPSASSSCFFPNHPILHTPVFSTLPKQRHRSPMRGVWELIYDSPSSSLPRFAKGPRREVTVLQQDPDRSHIANPRNDDRTSLLLEMILLELRQLDVRVLALSRDLDLGNDVDDDASMINSDNAIATAIYEVLAPGNSHVDSRWEQSFQQGLHDGYGGSNFKWHHQPEFKPVTRKVRHKNPFVATWQWLKRLKEL